MPRPTSSKPKTVAKTLIVTSPALNGAKFTVTVKAERVEEPHRDVFEPSSANNSYAETRALKEQLNARQAQHAINSTAHGLLSKLMLTLADYTGNNLSRMKVTEE
jgi:hypothetical protein